MSERLSSLKAYTELRDQGKDLFEMTPEEIREFYADKKIGKILFILTELADVVRLKDQGIVPSVDLDGLKIFYK